MVKVWVRFVIKESPGQNTHRLIDFIFLWIYFSSDPIFSQVFDGVDFVSKVVEKGHYNFFRKSSYLDYLIYIFYNVFVNSPGIVFRDIFSFLSLRILMCSQLLIHFSLAISLGLNIHRIWLEIVHHLSIHRNLMHSGEVFLLAFESCILNRKWRHEGWNHILIVKLHLLRVNGRLKRERRNLWRHLQKVFIAVTLFALFFWFRAATCRLFLLFYKLILGLLLLHKMLLE